MQDKLGLLRSVLGSDEKANRDYHQFHCPFCKHPKHKLGISLNTGKWKCWTCDSKGRTVSILFYKVRAGIDKVNAARELFNESQRAVETITTTPPLQLPTEYSPLYEPSISRFHAKAKSYVLSRGITEMDLLKHRIGHCESGRYEHMIILPSFDEEGTLNYFTARNYGMRDLKFLNPPNIDHNVLCDAHLINWQEPLILVESKLDAIVVRRNAVPLHGKFIPSTLKQKIIEEETPKVTFCLDGDAMVDAVKNSEYFLQHGIEVECVELPVEEDPTSLGFRGVWDYINSAKRMTERDTFKSKLFSKLKFN